MASLGGSRLNALILCLGDERRRPQETKNSTFVVYSVDKKKKKNWYSNVCCCYNLLFFRRAETSHDVWQFAIVVFVCLTGCLPWQKAAPDDPRYSRYTSWRGASGVTLLPSRRPKLFKLLTGKAQRLMRTLLDPRPDRRPSSLADLQRYLDDRWLVRSTTDRGNGNVKATWMSNYASWNGVSVPT